MQRLRRQPEKLAEIPVESRHLLQDWRSACDAANEADKTKKAALATLLATLGDAEGAQFPITVKIEPDEPDAPTAEETSQYLFTYLEQNGADIIDRKVLQEKHPEIYQAVSKPNRYRVPRCRKLKDGELV